MGNCVMCLGRSSKGDLAALLVVGPSGAEWDGDAIDTDDINRVLNATANATIRCRMFPSSTTRNTGRRQAGIDALFCRERQFFDWWLCNVWVM
ncbi:hypothetical protein ACQP1W_18840 [Spirillospora sp. CA-255316]